MSKVHKYKLQNGGDIAYCRHQSKSKNSVGIVYLTGYGSDMHGEKPTALEKFCIENDFDFLRFEYLGVGDSSGKFEEYSIYDWLQNTLEVIDNLTEGKQVLVGSSMGGWIMLQTALQRKNLIAGLVGIAPAPDFTETLMWNQFSQEHKDELQSIGKITLKHASGEDYFITWKMIEDGRKLLVMNDKIDISVPISIIHGMKDMDVPYQLSVELVDKLCSQDVELHLKKNSMHRFSEPAEIKFILSEVKRMVNKVINNE